jgi:pyrimidine-specific ribonucleoside hydrolase
VVLSLKPKILKLAGIILAIIALIIILIWPMAPLWAKLGANPLCLQGNFPDIKLVPCQASDENLTSATPLPPLPANQQQIPLIFDDDGSPDGTIALLYLLRNPRFDVRLVTVSPGEAHPEIFAGHLADLLAAVGKTDIPIGAGSEFPMEGDNAFPEPWRENSDNFWGISLEKTYPPPQTVSAAEMIRDTLSASEEPMLVFISGTHTNLAEALRLDPTLKNHIRGLYVMGGSLYMPGNIEHDWPEIHNQVAEWNIWVDPLAAHEVFTADLPLHLIPLDATSKVVWNTADAQTWKDSGTPEAGYASDILKWMLTSWSTNQAIIWDLLAAVTMADPRLCPQTSLALDVNTTPGPEQGQILVTQTTSNAEVCLQPDISQVKLNVADIFTSP